MGLRLDRYRLDTKAGSFAMRYKQVLLNEKQAL